MGVFGKELRDTSLPVFLILVISPMIQLRFRKAQDSDVNAFSSDDGVNHACRRGVQAHHLVHHLMWAAARLP